MAPMGVVMRAGAPYDEVADWYEHEFLAAQRAHGDGVHADALGIDRSLVELLGPAPAPAGGTAPPCLEVGCGTGIYAERVRSLGWHPVGVDLSAGMLGHARGRLPIAQADAMRLPVASGSMPAVISVMAHTDMPAYDRVLAEISRVLAPGGVFVHIGVHPCFCGGFADRSDPQAIVITPGYLDGSWTTDSWTDQGLRDKVGATHVPLAGLLGLVIDAGLTPERFGEGGQPTPVVLSFRARGGHRPPRTRGRRRPSSGNVEAPVAVVGNGPAGLDVAGEAPDVGHEDPGLARDVGPQIPRVARRPQ